MNPRRPWTDTSFGELVGIAIVILASSAGCSMCSHAGVERERMEREMNLRERQATPATTTEEAK
jgi:hypothetical protein